jgi:O-antigen ligase
LKKTDLISRAVELPAAVLVVVSLILIQALIGGTRLIFSLPAYAVLGITGLLCLFLVARPKPRPDQLCLTATALLFAYILARALYSPVPYLARTDIYAVLGGLIIYFFVACVFTSAKARMLVVAVLLTASLVHVMVGAIQFSRGNNFMLIPFLQRFDYGRRASGLYGCPNHLAGLLEVVGIFGVSLVWWSRWPVWGKLLIGYAAASCYAGLVLSGSRGGYLSALTSLFVIATLGMTILVRTSAKIFWRVGGAIAMVALLVGLVVTFSVRQNYYLSERTENILGENLSDPSSELRMELWQAALRQWRLA